MPTKFFLQASGKDCKRIMDGEKVVGLIEAYSDGTWAVHDISGLRLLPEAFPTPAKALAAYRVAMA